MYLQRIRILLLFIFVILLASCEENEQREIDVMILSTKTEARSKPGEAEVIKYGIVKYCTKNIDSTTIYGWEVFFNVHINHGTQLIAHESVYYTLEPGEESETRTVECIIPEYYEDAYKSTLKYIETW